MWGEIGILISAIVAAASVGSLATKVYYQRKSTNPNIKVVVNEGFLGSGDSGDFRSEKMVFVEARNCGERTVSLNSDGFLMPDKKKIIIGNPSRDKNLPLELSPEQSCKFWIEKETLIEGSKHYGYSGNVKIIGFYGDQVGRTYKSKPKKYEI